MNSVLMIGNDLPELRSFVSGLGFEIAQNPSVSEIAVEFAESKFDLLLLHAEEDPSDYIINYIKKLSSGAKTKIIVLAPDSNSEVIQTRLGGCEVQCDSLPLRFGHVSNLIVEQLSNGNNQSTLGKSETLNNLNQMLRTLNDRFQKELSQASDIQKSLVPDTLPSDDRMAMAVLYKPLADVGGDWYFARRLDDGKISFQIADVHGKGLSAAFLCSIVKLAFTATGTFEPGKQLSAMNSLLKNGIPTGATISLVTCLYDPETGVLKYSLAGHPEPIHHIAASGEYKKLSGNTTPLGDTEDTIYEERETTLAIGDCVVLYTDALINSKNRASETYGFDRANAQLCDKDGSRTIEEVLTSLIEDFEAFREERIMKDDLTVLLLKRTA